MVVESAQVQSELGADETRVAVPTTALELLTENVVHAGWEQSIATQRSFYVRGATWFHNHVYRPISRLQGRPEIDFGPIFEAYPEFKQPGFAWAEKFSPRQAMAALSIKNRKPVRFSKAVQTILLCNAIVAEEIAAGRSSVGTDDAFRRMRIEPAVFYIRDFTEEQIKQLLGTEKRLLELLREETGQKSRNVFTDMAKGSTVTKALADATRTALGKHCSGFDIGSIDNRYQSKVTKGASTAEALSG